MAFQDPAIPIDRDPKKHGLRFFSVAEMPCWGSILLSLAPEQSALHTEVLFKCAFQLVGT